MALTTPQGRGLGLIFAPPDARNWAFPLRSLAAPPDIDLRSQLQPVGNQGQLGSCTGWAGTASLEQQCGDGQRSPLYLYYWDRVASGFPTNQDTGATMLGLCKALVSKGAPPEWDWPYEIAKYTQQPPVAIDTDAARADSYYQVQGTGLALLQGVWAALDAGHLPLLALQVYESFETSVGGDGKVPMPRAGERVLGGHAVAACMWFNDNAAPGGSGWVGVQNSWGTAFGDQGYVYLPAGYFFTGIVQEAWVVIRNAPPVPPEPDPEPDVNSDAIRALTQQMRDMVTQAQLDRCPWDASKVQYQASMVKIMDRDIGPIKDVADQIDGLLPFEPGPEPPPPPGLRGVYGTYTGHGLAKDLYGGYTDDQVAWGPHHGLPIVAPADGRVEVYQIGTPLNAQPLALERLGMDYIRNWHALADDWVCRTGGVGVGAQTMFVAVFWPSAPLIINGQPVGHLHYGHVRGNVKTGSVQRREQFATSWDSGVRFEPGVPNARAAHTHCCAGAGSQLSPNGDLDGRLAVAAQGWSVTELGGVPGPTDYMTGLYCAGRRYADFITGMHPIPSMPS